MLTQNHALRRYILPLLPPFAVVLLVVALQTAGLEESLRYDRIAILAGQIWRVVTGNLVHLGWPHLWLNAAGLVLIYMLFGPLMSARIWLIHGLVASVVVGVGLLWLNPELRWYVGLSGTLHGLFIAGLLLEGRRDRRFAWIVFTVFAAKLAWEQTYGPMPGSEESAGGSVIVDAHLYGAIGGFVSYYALRLVERMRTGKKPVTP